MPRRSYHHGDLRRALLDAALQFVEESGPAALSLREITRRLGVSHAAPYKHFENREALLGALAEEGFRGLAAEMAFQTAGMIDPEERLGALGRAYVRYAIQHPGHFKVMFSTVMLGDYRSEALQEGGIATLEQLVNTIADLQADGVIAAGDPRRLALPAWSVVHGLAMLAIDEQLTPLGIDDLSDAIIDGVVGITRAGLKAAKAHQNSAKR